MGEMVLSRMECVDLFLELNRVCQEIVLCVPYLHFHLTGRNPDGVADLFHVRISHAGNIKRRHLTLPRPLEHMKMAAAGYEGMETESMEEEMER